MRILTVRMINKLLKRVLKLVVVTPILSVTIKVYVIKQYIIKQIKTNLGGSSQQVI